MDENKDVAIGVLKYIISYKEKHDGNSPSLREIAKGVGVKSHVNVAYHVKNLSEYGLLEIGTGQNRSIAVRGGKWIRPNWSLDENFDVFYKFIKTYGEMP